MSTFESRAGFGLVVLLSVVAFSNANSADYIRLVDSNPLPPLVAHEVSKRVVRLTSALDVISGAGPLFNERIVYRELQKNFNAELKRGFEQAKSLGQRGVLLKVQVLSTRTEANPFYSLRGNGAILIGVGKNPNDVCFVSMCYSSLQESIPSGTTLTQDSGYVWVEPTVDGRAYHSSLYRIDRMEERARQARLNEQTRAAYRTAITSEAISGYASQLAKTVRTRREREVVQELLKSRDDAVNRLNSVEANLSRELRRAERAAKTSSTLKDITGALAVASTIVMVNASMGEDVTAVGKFDTKEEALKTMKEIEAQTGERIKSLTLEQSTLRNGITGWEGSLLKIGVEYEMTPPAGSVLAPLP
jgi:hypothetical protein